MQISDKCKSFIKRDHETVNYAGKRIYIKYIYLKSIILPCFLEASYSKTLANGQKPNKTSPELYKGLSPFLNLHLTCNSL